MGIWLLHPPVSLAWTTALAIALHGCTPDKRGTNSSRIHLLGEVEDDPASKQLRAQKQWGRYPSTFSCGTSNTFLRGFAHQLWGRHCIHTQIEKLLEHLLPLVCLHGSFQPALYFLGEEKESIQNVILKKGEQIPSEANSLSSVTAEQEKLFYSLSGILGTMVYILDNSVYQLCNKSNSMIPFSAFEQNGS